MDYLPPHGRIDLHCHILPGIDDGCRTLSQSLECIRAWQANGFVGSVCTPHVATTWYPENSPRRIAGWVNDLRNELRAQGIDYALWPGGELRLSSRVVDWTREHGVPTLADSRCVLIDWWGNDWPTFCDDAIDYLLEQGYQPILAHPERMGLVSDQDGNDQLGPLCQRLIAKGVLLQGNFNSLSGGEGPTAVSLARNWLAESAYHVLASDTHEPPSVDGRVRGLAVALECVGEEVVRDLTEVRTRAILMGCVSEGRH